MPSAALTSSATMRTRSPCLRTVPSKSVLTPSFSPIVFGSSFLSLNRKDELRPIPFSPLICARAAINSSDKPSEKYSSFGSPLSLINGRTAIDFPWLAVVTSGLETFHGQQCSGRQKTNRRRAPHQSAQCKSKRRRGIVARLHQQLLCV